VPASGFQEEAKLLGRKNSRMEGNDHVSNETARVRVTIKECYSAS